MSGLIYLWVKRRNAGSSKESDPIKSQLVATHWSGKVSFVGSAMLQMMLGDMSFKLN